MKALGPVLIAVVVGTVALECARLLAMRLSFVGISPSILYYLAPLVTALLLNPWVWRLHWPSRLPAPSARLIRVGGSLGATILLWTFLFWETQSKVVAVDFPPNLSNTEVARLYDKIHDKWTYDPKKGVIYLPQGSTSALSDIKALKQSWATQTNRHD